MKTFLPIFLVMLTFSAASLAGVTKWIDSNGQVHYTDEPPPGNSNASALDIPAAASGIPEQKSLDDQLLELKMKQKAQEEDANKAEKQQERAKAQQTLCNQLRAKLTTLENGGRIVSYNEKGEAAFLDDEMIKTRIDETRKRISTECHQ